MEVVGRATNAPMSDVVCVICMEAVGEHDHTLDPCGHRFHTGCIISWMRQGTLSCPTCRDDLRTEVGAMEVHDRADYLRRRFGSRSDAPDEVRRMISALVKAERLHTTALKDLRDFERANRETLRRLKALRNRSRRWMFTTLDRKRQLGWFQSPQLSLPHLVLHR